MSETTVLLADEVSKQPYYKPRMGLFELNSLPAVTHIEWANLVHQCSDTLSPAFFIAHRLLSSGSVNAKYEAVRHFRVFAGLEALGIEVICKFNEDIVHIDVVFDADQQLLNRIDGERIKTSYGIVLKVADAFFAAFSMHSLVVIDLYSDSVQSINRLRILSAAIDYVTFLRMKSEHWYREPSLSPFLHNINLSNLGYFRKVNQVQLY
ncbi:hypothetical protein [Vibrio sp. F13]|uniref:hypothetical protein n=1 Tax=Vibrio sp. F13 TaxID=2070777 RepID=UPI0010BE0290|nr:hypothetical protein [Vibrio sp. F13]TKG09024.1 hypothetical protein FCV67_07900 [Vibrio sp. F13]